MESELRKAGAEDLQELLSVAGACVGVPQWSAAVWKQALESAAEPSPLRVVLVLVGEGRIVAFGVIRAVADEAEIETLGTLPTFRRLHLGAKICAALVQEAVASGARRIHLEVRSGNAAARALYQTLGFQVEGRRSGYYQGPDDDAILMSLSV